MPTFSHIPVKRRSATSRKVSSSSFLVIFTLLVPLLTFRFSSSKFLQLSTAQPKQPKLSPPPPTQNPSSPLSESESEATLSLTHTNAFRPRLRFPRRLRCRPRSSCTYYHRTSPISSVPPQSPTLITYYYLARWYSRYQKGRTSCSS